MTLSDKLNDSRSAILYRHADGPPVVVTILRTPTDQLRSYIRVEQWNVNGPLHTPLRADEYGMSTVLNDGAPELAPHKAKIQTALVANPDPRYVELAVERAKVATSRPWLKIAVILWIIGALLAVIGVSIAYSR